MNFYSSRDTRRRSKSFPASILFSISKSNCAIEEVLDDPNIKQAMQCSNIDFLEYLSRESSIIQLMEYTLASTKMFCDHYSRRSQLSLELLNAKFLGIQNSFCDNTVFIDYLNKFVNSDSQPIPLLCGHFASIIESYAKLTYGSFIKKINRLKDYLLQNIDVVALRDLFVLLVTECNSDFELASSDIIQICKKLKYMAISKQLGMVIAFSKIIAKNSDRISLFDEDSIMKNLLKLATKTSNHLLSREIYQFILTAKQNCENSIEIIDSMGDTISISYDNISPVSFVYFIQIYPQYSIKMIDYLFKDNSNTMINYAILKALAKVLEDKAELITTTDFITKIIDNFNTSNHSGHIAAFAELLMKNGPVFEALKNKNWIKFVKDQLIPYLKLKDGRYGGGICGDSCSFNESDIAVSVPIKLETEINEECSTKPIEQDLNDEYDVSSVKSKKSTEIDYESIVLSTNRRRHVPRMLFNLD